MSTRPLSLDSGNQNSQLNIASEITRIRGIADQQARKRGSDALTGPIPVETLLANCLTALQDNSNSVDGKIRQLFKLVTALQGAHVETSALDQSANQLVFTVRYPNGSIKTGTVNLI
jgi:hypothetical protein